MTTFTSSLRRVFFVPAVAGALLVGACSSQSQNGTSSVASPANAGAVNETREHNPLLASAWKLSDLSADQEVKLQAIEEKLRQAGAPRRAAQKDLAELFAKSLEAGKLDETAVNAQIDRIAQLADAEKDATAAALDHVHALLSPAQRSEVIELTKTAWKNHEGKEGKHHEGGPGMHMMKKMAEDLNLTDAQKQAFHDKLESMPKPDKSQFEGMKSKMKTVADAFVSDSFDAKALGVGDKGAARAKGFATRMEKMIEASIEILDPGQRATLAQKIREHAAKMEG